MEQITDINAFLEEAKSAVFSYESLTYSTKKLKDDKEKLEEALIEERKRQNNKVNETIAKRRNDIVKTYDSELESGRKKLSQVKGRREKAKAQGIRARIAQETEPVINEIKDYKQGIRDICKSKKVPAWTSGKVFLTLFFPSGALDTLVLVVLFLVLICLLPLGINYLFGNGSMVFLVACFMADFILFGGIYILLNRNLAFRHHDAYIQIRALRKKIANAENKVDNIKMSVKSDTNEAGYNLASYDDEVSQLEQSLADMTMQRNNALVTFDTCTRNIINDEIMASTQPKVDEAEAQAKKAAEAYADMEAKRQAKALELSDKYEVYLGKEFMSVDKIQSLQDVAGHSTATTIAELLKEYDKAIND